MPELEASRTLVKSTPELWAECSDSASLSRHLSAFGEIRITKLEPETAVAWEGDDVRGTVTLEPSGWGTRVVLTATADEAENAAAPTPAPGAISPGEEPVSETPPEPASPAAAEPEHEAEAEAQDELEPEPPTPPADEPLPAARRGLFARLFGFGRRSRSEAPLGDEDPLIELAGGAPQAEPAVTPATDSAQEPEPAEIGDDTPAAPELEVLVGALESLGAAHKRPFSRS